MSEYCCVVFLCLMASMQALHGDCGAAVLLPCKRYAFGLQKATFWRVKDGKSHAKRWPFATC